MAAFLGFAGVAHFIVPDQFSPLIPTWLPGDATFYTYASGVAEIAVAIGLFIPRTRRLAGWGAVLLFWPSTQETYICPTTGAIERSHSN